MNNGKRLLALSECADALSIVKEQMKRAAAQLAALSVANSNSPDDPDSTEAARLVTGVKQYIDPLRVSVQRRHDELARQFTQEWHS